MQDVDPPASRRRPAAVASAPCRTGEPGQTLAAALVSASARRRAARPRSRPPPCAERVSERASHEVALGDRDRPAPIAREQRPRDAGQHAGRCQHQPAFPDSSTSGASRRSSSRATRLVSAAPTGRTSRAARTPPCRGPAASRRERRPAPRASTRARAGRARRGDHQRDHALGGDDVGDQGRARPVAPGPCSATGSAYPAGTPALPGPLADPLPQLGLSALGRRLRPLELRQVGRQPRRPAVPGPAGPDASIRARSDHSNSTSGDRDRPPPAGPAPRADAVPGHLRLQVEAAERALPLVQVAEPAPRWASAADARPRSRPGGRTSRSLSRTPSGAPARDPHRPQALASLSVAPAQHDRAPVEPDVERPPATSSGVQLLGQASPRVHHEVGSRPGRTPAPCTSASALSRSAGVPAPAEHARAPAGRRAPARGPASADAGRW